MAGIGFTLRTLVNQDNLLGVIQGYSYAALISAGPWLFTILSLGGITLLSKDLIDLPELTTFQVIVTYNFSLSLVLSGPVVLTATRYLSDCIYMKSVKEATGLLLTALCLVYGIGLLTVLPFYVFWVDLPVPVRFAAIGNYFLVAGIWVIAIFHSALKDYATFALTFGVGMVVSFLASVVLAPEFGAAGMLFGFSIGLTFIMFATIAKIFAEYPYRISQPFAFLSYFRKYWDLALAGIAFSGAIWVDKWVMWFAEDRQVIGGVLVYHQAYDVAMFLAYLTVVPAIALFTLSSETGFFERYNTYYQDIQEHATYKRICSNQQAIIQYVLENSRNTIVLQAVICAVAVFMAPQILAVVGGSYLQLGVFRFGVLGAFFHVLIMLASIILTYLDLRRFNLALQLLFLVLNGVFTYISMRLGFSFYGYGYFLATLITFVASYVVVIYALRKLPYLSFIGNNPSAR